MKSFKGDIFTSMFVVVLHTSSAPRIISFFALIVEIGEELERTHTFNNRLKKVR